ncbi:MAG: glutathione S-transferase family protein, partial [Hyphomicrobiaceae bacterium]
MLKLYFSPFTSSLATHIALIETGAEFELVPKLMAKDEQKQPGFLAINPEGKLPTLITKGGNVLTEVAGTLYYVAKTYPSAGLWPEGDLEAEAQVISWMSFVASTMHGSRSNGNVAIAAAFAVAEKRLAGREWIIGRYSIADIHLFRVYWRFWPGLDLSWG